MSIPKLAALLERVVLGRAASASLARSAPSRFLSLDGLSCSSLGRGVFHDLTGLSSRPAVRLAEEGKPPS